MFNQHQTETMKKATLLLLTILMATTLVYAKKPTKFQKKLSSMPGVTSVTPYKSTKFKQAYIITFTQYIDYRDTALGTFTQRALVCHVNEDSVTVLVTEGYSLEYYLQKPNYREELSDIFNTNCIIIEHRYFSESTPKIKDKKHFWDYLTTFNAATDHHRFAEAFHKIYHGKFIATGVSKGGICANMFRAYYPEDVDITVPYVAPLCDGVEDPRMAKEIQMYGSFDQQSHINGFINYLFDQRHNLIPMLRNYCDSTNLKPKIRIEELYDYTIMDMHVAILARGEVKKIPDYKVCPLDTTFAFLIKYGAPEGFTSSYDNMPYYVQAARELGHYALDITQYKGLKALKSTKDYLRKTALPEPFEYAYDPSMRKMVLDFLNHKAEKMLFIYGEYDPWTAVGIKDLVHNPNVYVFINPGNCHRSKIRNFPEEQKNKIIAVLSNWLYQK